MAKCLVDVFGVHRASGVKDTMPAVDDYPIEESLGTDWTSLAKEARLVRPSATYDLEFVIRVV